MKRKKGLIEKNVYLTRISVLFLHQNQSYLFNEHAGHGGNYQSWNYYHEDFGIYDDDVEIVTLDQAEFQQRLAQLSLKFVEIFLKIALSQIKI